MLVTIPLNPLSCTFYKERSVSPEKYGILPSYLQYFHIYFLFILCEKAYERCFGHCDKNYNSSFGRF